MREAHFINVGNKRLARRFMEEAREVISIVARDAREFVDRELFRVVLADVAQYVLDRLVCAWRERCVLAEADREILRIVRYELPTS